MCALSRSYNLSHKINFIVFEYHFIHFIFLFLLTHILTPYSTFLPDKLTGYQLVKEFPTFYGTWKFVTTFTNASHLFLSWSQINPVQALTSPFLKIHLILSFHLRLNVQSGLFPSGFPTKIWMRLSSLPYVLRAPPNTLFQIWSPECYLVRSTFH